MNEMNLKYQRVFHVCACLMSCVWTVWILCHPGLLMCEQRLLIINMFVFLYWWPVCETQKPKMISAAIDWATVCQPSHRHRASAVAVVLSRHDYYTHFYSFNSLIVLFAKHLFRGFCAIPFHSKYKNQLNLIFLTFTSI